MTTKETGEIRRRIRPEKNNISYIYGCYVNDSRSVISEFRLNPGMLPQNETEKYLNLLRKVLSGTPGKNLSSLEYSAEQAMEAEQHKALCELREAITSLHCPETDDPAVRAFFDRIITALEGESNYLILLAGDAYDVQSKGKDGIEMEDTSSEIFRYMLCCACPVKPAKSALRYAYEDNVFHDKGEDWLVNAPEFGFMFPSFDDRKTNLYNVQFYSKDGKTSYDELSQSLFGLEGSKPAAEVRSTFEEVLSESLGDECSYDVMQTVHTRLRQMIDVHKESKAEEPLEISERQLENVLDGCGVSEECRKAFSEQYEEQFGKYGTVSPNAIINSRRFDIKTPDVVINVNPERSDLIETRVIDGTKYILICADEGVEVNGVNIHIAQDK